VVLSLPPPPANAQLEPHSKLSAQSRDHIEELRENATERPESRLQALREQANALGVEFDVDEIGRVTKLKFRKLDRWVAYSYTGVEIASPRSAISIGSIADSSQIQTKLLIRNGADQQKLGGALYDEDEFERQQRELLELAIATYSNPWNFDNLTWFDALSEWQKEGDKRKTCLEDCKATCDAGGQVIGGICGIAAGLVTAPTVVGVVGAGLGCWSLGNWYGDSCNDKCAWRCR
jgi:hypothetical protein